MRTFRLVRREDATGISGTGRVAVGVEFPSGMCVMEWTTLYSSLGVYPNREELMLIHGHQGKTVLEWDDDDNLSVPEGDDFEVANRYGHGV